MTNRYIMVLFALLASAIMASAPVRAQNAVSLQGEVQVERTVETNGTAQTVLEEPTSVVPGDRLVFSTHYSNDSADTVENFVVTNPLPSAVVLASDDAAFVVSIDGGNSFAPLANLRLIDEAAAQPDNTRPAEPRDVTHIRWTLARLEPGESGSLTYTAFVR